MSSKVFFVVFAVFAVFLAAAVVEGQTPRERDAYAALARAVQEAQSAPGPDSAARRLGGLRRAMDRAYSVFQAQERRRDAAVDGQTNTSLEMSRSNSRAQMRYLELLGVSTAAERAWNRLLPRMHASSGGWLLRGSDGTMESCSKEYRLCQEMESAWVARASSWYRAGGRHWRYRYAAAEAMRGAADGLEGLVSRSVGFDVRHNAMLLRLASAKQAVIQSQGAVLRRASEHESWTPGVTLSAGWEGVKSDFDQSLQGLVRAAGAVADGLASYRQAITRGGAGDPPAARGEPGRGEPGPAAPSPAPVAPRVESAPAQPEAAESLAERYNRLVDEAVAEAERLVAELERATCGIFRGTNARIAINRAGDRLEGMIPGGQFVPVDRDGAYESTRRRLDGLWDRVEAHVRTLDPRCP